MSFILPADVSFTESNIYIASEEDIRNATNVLSWGEKTTEGRKFSTRGAPHGGEHEHDYVPRGSQDHPGGQDQDYTRGQGNNYAPHGGSQDHDDYASHFGGQEHSYGFSSRYDTRQSRGGHKKSAGRGVGGSEEDLHARDAVMLRESRKLRSPGGEEQVPRTTKQGPKLSISSDSGISLPQPTKWPNQFPSADVLHMVEGTEPRELSDNILSKGFTPFYMFTDPLEGSRDYLHDSDSEG